MQFQACAIISPEMQSYQARRNRPTAYRYEGQQRRVTLGRHPAMTLAEAREA
jgi:hypothetical protein